MDSRCCWWDPSQAYLLDVLRVVLGTLYCYGSTVYYSLIFIVINFLTFAFNWLRIR